MVFGNLQCRGSRLLSLILLRPLLAAACSALAQQSTTPAADQFQDGWRCAQAIGRFHFEVTTQQTTLPTLQQENTGCHVTSERFDRDGPAYAQYIRRLVS
jgi:hypothetical protein